LNNSDQSSIRFAASSRRDDPHHRHLANYLIIAAQLNQIYGDALQAIVLKNTASEQATKQVIARCTEAIGKVR